ncbi:hypothetical protein TCAL_02927 [Tigriopus californicus]|uniref:Uncharacterized protein n=1 Tax=Tigriopus californicus TaxID=6832 RepID=A0A553NQS7_TIGCA|nr:hypothetical protein TCAL_02927 [Tigriopus californicus]
MLLLYLCITFSIVTFPIVALLCWIWFCWAVCYVFTHKDKIREYRGQHGPGHNIEPPATIMIVNEQTTQVDNDATKSIVHSTTNGSKKSVSNDSVSLNNRDIHSPLSHVATTRPNAAGPKPRRNLRPKSSKHPAYYLPPIIPTEEVRKSRRIPQSIKDFLDGEI